VFNDAAAWDMLEKLGSSGLVSTLHNLSDFPKRS